MDIGEQGAGVDDDGIDRCREEVVGEQLLDVAGTKDAAVAGAGHRHPHFALPGAGNEHAGHGVAGRRVPELFVSGLGRNREGHLGDDLAVIERGCKETGEEFIGRDRPLVGVDRRAERQRGGG